MFEDIEKHKSVLQIFSIGLSETSIEEVFMKMWANGFFFSKKVTLFDFSVEEDEPDEIITVTNPQISHLPIAHDGTLEEAPSQFINVGPQSKLEPEKVLPPYLIKLF